MRILLTEGQKNGKITQKSLILVFSPELETHCVEPNNKYVLK